jgi:hypothetical protein
MIEFNKNEAIQILSRTPLVLKELLSGLPRSWIHANEGGESWSPYDIVGHLIHGEKTDWIPRMNIILDQGVNKTFQPFDRFAQFRNSGDRSLEDLLNEFTELRLANTDILRNTELGWDDLRKEGIHPAFGKVSLKELLASWVVHDLNHIGQLCRVLAFQYKREIGPWTEYMGILHWKGSHGR